MTGRRRHSSLRALAWGMPLFGIVVVLAAAEAILSHGWGLVAVIVALPAAGYLVGRRHGRRAGADDQAQLRAENRALKAKCKTLSDMINGPEVPS